MLLCFQFDLIKEFGGEHISCFIQIIVFLQAQSHLFGSAEGSCQQDCPSWADVPFASDDLIDLVGRFSDDIGKVFLSPFSGFKFVFDVFPWMESDSRFFGHNRM